MTAGELLAATEEEFRAIVDADIHVKDRERAAWETGRALRSPAVAERFHIELLRTLKSLEGQLATNESSFEAAKARVTGRLSILKAQIVRAQSRGDRAEEDDLTRKAINVKADLHNKVERKYQQQRSKILAFKTGVDMALVESQAVLDGLNNSRFARMYQLEAAIADHRLACESLHLEPEQHDIALWGVLGQSA